MALSERTEFKMSHGHDRPEDLSPKPSSQSGGMSKLLWAMKHDPDLALVRLLQENSQLVNEKDYDGRTALHVASMHGWTRAAEILLKHGAMVNELDRRGNSPAHNAVQAEKKEMVELLKKYHGKDLWKDNHCDQMELKVVPPRARRADWEIDPKEIDLSTSELIGKGSFGEIRKASWRGTPVAVKKILPALSNDNMVIQDFRHEVDLLVRIRHPNCVQFLGAVINKKPFMLVTEYLPEGDLHRVLREKHPLKTGDVAHFALDIARGMAYLHSGTISTIIHRDLKPRNILVGDGNLLKVGDFGLSKLIEVTKLHDMYKLTGETGSYRYMAPEVFLHSEYDNKVDVFSFAMILYEGVDPYDAARSVAREEQRPDFDPKVEYPENMKELIVACWQQSPSNRPPFVEIIKRLEKISENYSPRDQPHHHHFSPRHKIQQVLSTLSIHHGS